MPDMIDDIMRRQPPDERRYFKDEVLVMEQYNHKWRVLYSVLDSQSTYTIAEVNTILAAVGDRDLFNNQKQRTKNNENL